VRLTEFRELVEGRFGRVRGGSMLVDHVLSGFGGRTAVQAIDEGVDPARCGARCAPTSTCPATSGDPSGSDGDERSALALFHSPVLPARRVNLNRTGVRLLWALFDGETLVRPTCRWGPLTCEAN